MIELGISKKFEHQVSRLLKFNCSVFVVDYSNSSLINESMRGVEIYAFNPPEDAAYFSIYNENEIDFRGLIFDHTSFRHKNGKTKTQCEAVFFPNSDLANTWVLFCELKYSNLPNRNSLNLTKALKQLYKTRYYYVQENVISTLNNSYLVASLPLQSEPFPNFILSPALLLKLKSKRNIIIRLQNSVSIKSLQHLSI